MKKSFTKLSAFMVCLALLFTCSLGAVPLSVSAETKATTFTAKVGPNTYEYTVTDNKATIVGGEVSGDVTIPENLGGYPVTALGDKAFYYKEKITSVTIPGCVKTIGDGCFEDCYNLESAVLENGVEKIGAYAFYSFVSIPYLADCGCCTDFIEYYSSLKNVVLPDSVRWIGDSAFAETLLSEELVLPSALEYLGKDAFSSTNIEKVRIPTGMKYNKGIVFSRFASLKEIVVDAGNTDYYMDNELLMANGGTVALYFVGNNQTEVIVPDTTNVIEKFCFEGTKVQQVTLSANLREIREKAFYNCDKLSAIAIPEGTTTIENKSFSGCEILSDVQLPTTLKTVGDNGFSNCPSLEQITFTSDTLTLGSYALSGCKALNNVSFTGNNVSIGDSAFYKSLNLKQLVLSPEKVHLGANLIVNTGIETLVIRSNNITTDPNFYSDEQLYSYGYPGYEKHNFQKLIIGKDVTTLNEMLYLPIAIWYVELEEGNTTFVLEDNVLYNSDKTELIRFFSKTDVSTTRSKFIIPETVTKIGNKAFLGATISRVELPSALEIIGDEAFYKSDVYGTDTLNNVDNFILPASVEKIGYRAFGKTNISRFGITGNKLVKLAPNMFHGCNVLKDVYYTGSKEELDKIVVITEGSYLSSARFHYNATIAEHQFVKTVGKKATVKNDGYYLYTCPCGQSYKVPIYKISVFDIAYSPFVDHFSTEVYAPRRPQVLTDKLEYGKDYTYKISTKNVKDDYFAVEYTFMGDLYEGTVTKLHSVQLDAVKSLTSKPTTNGVTLSWKKVSPATGYKIWRRANSKDEWKLIATTSKLTYTDSKLDNNAYQYKVAAYLRVQDTCDVIDDKPVTIDVLPGGNTLYKIDGKLTHVVNREIVKDTTLVKYNSKYYYVKKGVLAKKSTGFVKYNGSKYYVKNGVSPTGKTMVNHKGNWYYIKYGKLATASTGFVPHNGSKYYVKNGVAPSGKTMVKHKGSWYYIKYGKLATASTGFVPHNGGKYYVKNGVAPSGKTMVKHKGSWYYIKYGKLATASTGFVPYNGSKYYVKNGVAPSGKTLVKHDGKYKYVKNGVFTKSTTLVKHNGKYKYIKNGVFTKATTRVKYNGKYYKVKNGVAII